jgi:hypothetical protein
MNNRSNLSAIVVFILCLFTILSADTGVGISDVGSISSVTSMEEVNTMPSGFCLEQNYPNPFNPRTTISYSVGVNGYSPVQVDLSIYTNSGQKVATLVAEKQLAGFYTVEWNAENLAGGVYFYRMDTDQGFTQTHKLVLIK